MLPLETFMALMSIWFKSWRIIWPHSNISMIKAPYTLLSPKPIGLRTIEVLPPRDGRVSD